MTTLKEALYSKLKNDVTLAAAVSGVYEGIAPASATYPFLSYSVGSAEDSYTLGRRISTAYSVEVRCVDDAASPAAANTAMERVDAILTDATLTVTDKTTWKVRRARTTEYDEQDGDTTYWHVVSEFEVELA